MIGAILGDMIGAPYEFDRGDKTKDFPLFGRGSKFTDDSVMTIAVAEALMDSSGKTDEEVKVALVHSMQKWGRKYPNAGYGGMFRRWLREEDPKPYGSFGNGSAMRVSSAGWLYEDLEMTQKNARLTAVVTHNHPEGIKGAEAVASAIFLARSGRSKEEIKEYIIDEFGYDLSRSCNEIRPGYHHMESCQQTVPEAVTAFLEGEDFEDVIRTAVSLGGDSDTLTCIAGSIAEAFYGVPDELQSECLTRLPEDILNVLNQFEEFKEQRQAPFHDMFLDGNERIEAAIGRYYADRRDEDLIEVLGAIRQRMHEDGHFLFPIILDEEDENNFFIQTVLTEDDVLWQAAFTSRKEFEKGEPSKVLSNFIDSSLKACLESDSPGYIINPWGQPFLLSTDLIRLIFQADEGVEYSVPEDSITEKLLEDGTFLSRAIEICNRNRTQMNLFKLARILRDSYVWIPCNMIISDADHEAWSKVVEDAKAKGDLKSLIGQEFTNREDIRFVPDILKSGDELYFPVFSSQDEMGDYGNNFSKVQRHFLDAVRMAKNNEKNVYGIVINAFSEPFVLPKDLFEMITRMESSLEPEGEE